jgi:hypothetical protein
MLTELMEFIIIIIIIIIITFFFPSISACL